MITTRGRLRRAALGGAMVAFTCLASTAHAEPAPSSAAPDAATESAPAATPASPGAAASPGASATTEPPDTSSKRTAWPWIVMGGGVAMIVTATVLEIHAVKEDDRREADEAKLFGTPDGPAKAALQQSASQHDNSAKSTRTASLVVGTVGFLAVAGAVVLWFVEGGSSSSTSSAPAPSAKTGPSRPREAKPSLLPSFGPGYAGASFGASF